MQPNDLAFAGHALVLSLVILSQTLVYKVGLTRVRTSRMRTPVSLLVCSSLRLAPSAQRGAQYRLSRFHRAVILLLLSIITLAILLAWSGWLAWLDFVILLSAVKLYVTAAKMVPQAWYNYRRKSTVGWSIENILMDISGGILSL